MDFLKTTVLLSAGAATALAAVTVAGAGAAGEAAPALVSMGWWVLAVLVGLLLGRRAEVNPPIARLLAGARSSTALPELRPGLVLVNRLWPLMVFTLALGALAFLAPQIPGIATGLPIILALHWRRQEAAVTAIEERDGVRFYVERTSPVRPMSLVRTTGFQTIRPTSLDGAT
ncbi:MAG TPA: hypothetical protein VGN69_03595 [Solirubrobacteraceae bacterium]|nr:hypothetical protein [Solirubrobacteraceae bacterium]